MKIYHIIAVRAHDKDEVDDDGIVWDKADT